ncbi:MAG: histidine kinase, partial [Fluviicola sp.]
KVKLLAKFENEIIDISIGKNEIFVGLYQGGLKILSNYTKKLQIESYFNTESVTSVIKNNMNEYWVSTLNKGLFYIPGFKNILITKNSEKTLSHIIQVYRQTDSSFITLDNSGNILKNEFLILNEPFCKTFSIHKSNVFYNGTNSGVFISQHLKKSTFYSSSYKANLAFKKYFNYKNEIYSFSNNLIFSIDKNYKQHKVLFVRNRIYFVSIHNNILWISTEKGLYTYDLEKKKFEKRFNTIKSRINSILIANDKIYLSTKGEGLYECSKTKVIQHFTTKNGLLSNFSNDLYLDKKNTLWILTKKGINFIQKEAKTIESAHFVNHFFDEKIYSFSIDKEDLFLCSDKGVFKLADYSSLLNHNSNLKVYFEDQKIKAKNSSIFFGFFPAKKYSFHTKLNCLLYKNLGNIQYEYRLLPQSKSWQKSSLSRINFTDLKYGDYVLEVRSLLSNDEKTKTSTFLFTIEKQYFETWWFFILCIVSIVLIFYFFYKYIQSNTKKRERKKQENQLMLSQMESKALRAQMNPHFIFNAMNSIQNFLISDQEIEAVTFLGKFARLIRNILESTKSELITIKNEREILETYIELEQLRCSYSFDFEFTIDESISLEASQIPSMIIQPFIENAIIHGLIPLTERKGLLQIYFSQNEENFFCTVEDNGVGRKQAQINNEKNRKFHTSMGMGITFDRIEQIQKMYGKTVSIQIIDKPEVENMSSGTKIIINFPKLNLPL